MPKEISSFRINFEGIAWSKTQDSIPNAFDPDQFTPIELSEQPTKFNLQAAGNVSNSDLYKNVVLNNVSIEEESVKGTLFNSGLQEITVPQLLVTYYTKDKKMVWVDHMFLKNGIRQQRKQYFSYPILKNDTLKVISTDMSNCYVNGLPNEDIATKIIADRIENHDRNNLLQIDDEKYQYLKIEMNNYIGNPK